MYGRRDRNAFNKACIIQYSYLKGKDTKRFRLNFPAGLSLPEGKGNCHCVDATSHSKRSLTKLINVGNLGSLYGIGLWRLHVISLETSFAAEFKVK